MPRPIIPNNNLILVSVIVAVVAVVVRGVIVCAIVEIGLHASSSRHSSDLPVPPGPSS